LTRSDMLKALPDWRWQSVQWQTLSPVGSSSIS
jgi:hypothetical protein